MNTLRHEIEEKPPGHHLRFEKNWVGKLYADRHCINGGLYLNYVELVKSAFLPGKYDIITCSCGESGCAGIFELVTVTHDGDRIVWHLVEPGPERWFEFSKDQYRSALLESLRWVQAEVPRPENPNDYPFGHTCIYPWHIDWCIRTLETGIIEETGYEQ